MVMKTSRTLEKESEGEAENDVTQNIRHLLPRWRVELIITWKKSFLVSKRVSFAPCCLTCYVACSTTKVN